MAVTNKLINQTKVFLHWLAKDRLDQRAKNSNEKALREVLAGSGETLTEEIIKLHNAFISGMNTKD